MQPLTKNVHRFCCKYLINTETKKYFRWLISLNICRIYFVVLLCYNVVTFIQHGFVFAGPIKWLFVRYVCLENIKLIQNKISHQNKHRAIRSTKQRRILFGNSFVVLFMARFTVVNVCIRNDRSNFNYYSERKYDILVSISTTHLLFRISVSKSTLHTLFIVQHSMFYLSADILLFFNVYLWILITRLEIDIATSMYFRLSLALSFQNE